MVQHVFERHTSMLVSYAYDLLLMIWKQKGKYPSAVPPVGLGKGQGLSS